MPGRTSAWTSRARTARPPCCTAPPATTTLRVVFAPPDDAAGRPRVPGREVPRGHGDAARRADEAQGAAGRGPGRPHHGDRHADAEASRRRAHRAARVPAARGRRRVGHAVHRRRREPGRGRTRALRDTWATRASRRGPGGCRRCTPQTPSTPRPALPGAASRSNETLVGSDRRRPSSLPRSRSWRHGRSLSPPRPRCYSGRAEPVRSSPGERRVRVRSLSGRRRGKARSRRRNSQANGARPDGPPDDSAPPPRRRPSDRVDTPPCLFSCRRRSGGPRPRAFPARADAGRFDSRTMSVSTTRRHHGGRDVPSGPAVLQGARLGARGRRGRRARHHVVRAGRAG